MDSDVDRLRELFSRWARGDFDTPAFFGDDLELVTAQPERSTHRGVEGLRDVWFEFLEQWDDLRVEGEEFEELKDGRILVLARFRGRGTTSGAPVEQPMAAIVRMRRGQVVFMQGYWNRADGLADAGLTSD